MIGIQDIAGVIEKIFKNGFTVNITVKMNTEEVTNFKGIQKRKNELWSKNIDLNKKLKKTIPGTDVAYFFDGKLVSIYQRGTCTTSVTLEEIERLSSLPKQDAHHEIRKEFPKRTQRPIVNKVVSLQRNGRINIRELVNQNFQSEAVIQESSKNDEGDMDNSAEKLDDISIEEIIRNKRFYPLPGERKIQYIENGDYLVISNNGGIIKTTWPEIIRLSKLDNTLLNSEVVKAFPDDSEKRYALVSFVHAYRDERVRDPDAISRPVLSVETRPDENYGKVEGNKE